MPQTQGTMTEQEAEALEVRLTRVWTPQKIDFRYLKFDSYPNAFKYIGCIKEEVSLEVDDNDGYSELSLCLNIGAAFLMAVMGRGIVDESTCLPNDILLFHKKSLVQWRPLFRRNCWLSGFDIGATAHEKAEWIQGFSREEIEAWNLKM